MTDTQTQTADSEPLLSLSALAPKRPTVKIATPDDPDGSLYELRLMEHDFSPEAHACFDRDLAEFDALWAKVGSLVCKTSGSTAVDGECPEHEGTKCLTEQALSKNEGKRMSMLLGRLVGQVLDAPKAVTDVLSDEQKRTVVVTFQYAPVLVEALAQQAKTGQETKPGASPSTTGS